MLRDDFAFDMNQAVDVFEDLINPSDAKQYIAGLIILGAAPCTAMVFVWSNLTDGDPSYTLIQVTLNDFIMIFAFAPIVALLLGVTDLYVPWQTLTASVVIYVVIPLLAGVLTRQYILKNLEYKINSFSKKSKPLSIFGLLGIVILLFGFCLSTIFFLISVFLSLPLLHLFFPILFPLVIAPFFSCTLISHFHQHSAFLSVEFFPWQIITLSYFQYCLFSYSWPESNRILVRLRKIFLLLYGILIAYLHVILPGFP